MINPTAGISRDEIMKFKQEWNRVTSILKPIYEHADERNAKYDENKKNEERRNTSGKTFR